MELKYLASRLHFQALLMLSVWLQNSKKISKYTHSLIPHLKPIFNVFWDIAVNVAKIAVSRGWVHEESPVLKISKEEM